MQDTRAALLHLRRLLSDTSVQDEPQALHEHLAEVFYANQHLFEKLQELRQQLADPEAEVYQPGVQRHHELHVDGLVSELHALPRGFSVL